MPGSALHFIDSYHLLTYDSLDSTNEEAKRLAKAGGQHGALIWAEEQTHGKGRLQRNWHSPKGNLHCSLLLRPMAHQIHLQQLSFVTSLAIAKALEPMIAQTHRVALKWPNDILLDGKKLGGILLETLPMPDGALWVIIGVGINVLHSPDNVQYPSISLTNADLEIITPKIMLSHFLNCFEPLYDQWLEEGFEFIRKGWQERAAFMNETIALQLADKTVEGVFSGITSKGELQMTVPGQATTVYAAGDVSMQGQYAAHD